MINVTLSSNTTLNFTTVRLTQQELDDLVSALSCMIEDYELDSGAVKTVKAIKALKKKLWKLIK